MLSTVVEFRPQARSERVPSTADGGGSGVQGEESVRSSVRGTIGGVWRTFAVCLLLRWGCEAAMSHCVTTVDGGPASSQEDDRRGPCLCWALCLETSGDPCHYVSC